MFSEPDYLLVANGASASALAGDVFPRVFRTDFSQPGFALIRLPASAGSSELRRLMAELKEALAGMYPQKFGRSLVYLSLARFDQQVTTKLHLDGAPEESFLMLGYEPSGVPSSLALADYSRAAHDLGVTPARFLADWNPMFLRGERQLTPYVTPVAAFDPGFPQVLLINNSSRPFVPGEANQLGVLHQATVPRPSADAKRVVNSAMLAAADQGGPVSTGDVSHFLGGMPVASRYGS